MDMDYKLIGYAALGIVAIIILIAVLIKLILAKIRENEVLKYEFLTIIGHKFLTPLTQVKWLLEMSIKDEQDSFKRENLQTLQKSNQELIGLTGTLIKLTTTDEKVNLSYKFEKTELCEFVRAVGEGEKKSFQEKNISFAIQCAEGNIPVSVDHNAMTFVLQVVMQNACIYTPPGKQASVAVYTEKDKAVIAVSDNGIGIDPSDLKRIFVKFYRGHNAQEVDSEGFGVDLYMARSIMRRHNGTIEGFSSGLKQGATFVIKLPLVK